MECVYVVTGSRYLTSFESICGVWPDGLDGLWDALGSAASAKDKGWPVVSIYRLPIGGVMGLDKNGNQAPQPIYTCNNQ